ncbi:cell wall-binding repeat-containing protein [Alkalihalobacillus hwajinpoensis]|uniref:cell wall-binding repeat-containing protein n=1 Tax=Guptibacillus hwajinpoensis TaxID=208199 RepID=UPI0018847405|nr:cell wall-binding repeat-containing protein [Pseudalkalibacillus hwajinpoensis]MBF0705294.1 cell wall-binding repeat-containing protein [Pseudalkalibacillus hwajinpoensis]
MNMKKPLFGVLSTAALAMGIAAASPSTPVEAAAGDFDLTIMHTNDTHAHLDNAPKRVTAVEEIRAARANTILLDAGDVFSGTLFFNKYKGLADVQFMNMMKYDAMVPGNHEFDEGPKTFSEFVKQTKFPIVSSNIDYSKDPYLSPLYKNEMAMTGDDGTIYPAVILDVNGEEVGVFGLTIESTDELSSPGETISFQNHQEQAEKMIKMFEDKGVNKIVALTHLGKAVEVELAKSVEGIDVVVGGHSHTTIEEAVVVDTFEDPTLVVQANEYSNFLGDLEVTFNEEGVLTDWDNELLDLGSKSKFEPNAEAKALYDELKKPLEEIEKEVVGQSDVYLNGKRASVRTGETNLGNLITDGMLYKAQQFTDATIAITNGGGIRESIDEGPITLGEVLTTMPFGNNLVTLDMTGAEIIDSLEHGVSGVETQEGRFAQVAGLRYSFDKDLPSGERILDVNVKTENGYEDIDPEGTYTVATNAYIAQGGDGYDAMGEAAADGRMNELFFVDFEVFTEYLDEIGTVKAKDEARIAEADAERIQGETRYETSVKISQEGWETADTVVLARGDSFPDALAGAPLAYKYDAPILLTESGSLNKMAKEEIARLGAKDVIILGGTSAVSNYVKFQLEGMGIEVERIAGDNRFDTAANIAARLGGSPNKAIVANGMNFPDALAIAPYAAQKGYPILLTEADEIPSATSNALKGIDGSIIVGGETAVNGKLDAKLHAEDRYAGDNRFGTAADIATNLNPSARVYVSTGMNFADALSGSVLAAKQNAAMLLVKPNMLPKETTEAIEDMEAYDFNVLGGENAVSNDILDQLKK